ncbi:SPFH domain-containing protein [Streptomyces sp. NPDC047971]|uniref:SPFH domain-containing protein n=1 Tax=Streptomyces sp. NPDC047971 TaxID=3154499 RepID=UPI0033C077AB
MVSAATSAPASGAPVTTGGEARRPGSPGAASTSAGGADGSSGATAADAGHRPGSPGAAAGGAAGTDARPGSPVGPAGPAPGSDVHGGPGAEPGVPADWPGSPWGSVTLSGGPQAPGVSTAPDGAPGTGRPGSPVLSAARSGAPGAAVGAAARNGAPVPATGPDHRPGAPAAGSVPSSETVTTPSGPGSRTGVSAAAGSGPAPGSTVAQASSGKPTGGARTAEAPSARSDGSSAPESARSGSVTPPTASVMPGGAAGRPDGPGAGKGERPRTDDRPGSPADPAGKPVAVGAVGELRRIIGVADVGVIAVPVAAEALAAPAAPAPPTAVAAIAPRIGGRRKTVIGAETTGSIPVHLLFRDEPEPDDDGGPATIAMAPPVAARAVIPAPARPEPSRPAPTADPKLVEREGAVLPGWIGVVGGLLALAGCASVLWWAGAVPAELARMLRVTPRPYHGIHLGQWALLALGVLAVLFTLGGLGRGRVGYAWVLTLFGDYRGSVRRTGLVWVSPLLLRRRVDVRLRHWRSEPLTAVDAKGTALRVVVLVVWRVRDTVRAALGVDGHEEYLREQVEAAMARVLSQLPADAFHEDAPTLRDAEAVGEALTRMLSAECAPVGIDVFSAQPTRIEYAPEVAAAMQRRRIAAIDAKHRDSVLTSVVDAVDDVVHRLTTRGLVELDDYERKALVKDLTVAFYTGRTGPVEGA